MVLETRFELLHAEVYAIAIDEYIEQLIMYTRIVIKYLCVKVSVGCLYWFIATKLSKTITMATAMSLMIGSFVVGAALLVAWFAIRRRLVCHHCDSYSGRGN